MTFYFLSISGLAIIFILQTLINIFSTLNLIPTKGMTLPFLSYGGSSLISCAILIGFILSLSKKYEKFKNYFFALEELRYVFPAISLYENFKDSNHQIIF